MYQLHPIAKFITLILEVIQFAVIVYVILDLLIQFRVLNSQNTIVMKVHTALGGYIEPVLDKIRKFIPVRGGLDFSPIVLLILIYFVSYTISYYASQA